MSWFMRGVQSAVFHYLSCAPCTSYMHRSERKKQAKKDRKIKKLLEKEQPDLYRHPDPSGTNPYWSEEILMGPGPPPRTRKSKRTNTGSRASKVGNKRAITTAGTQSTVVSNGGSFVSQLGNDPLRMSDDTLDDDDNDDDDDANWNRRRYQREDEDLWGFEELDQPTVKGSSVGVAGLTRPSTAKSSGESYYTARVPPVNDLHPPVVSIPSSHPADNRWMLQPPPKASIMAGKERASYRSRSGSGASSRLSSRLEVNLQRQVSSRQLQAKISRGETPELPPVSRGNSYSNFHGTVNGHPLDGRRTPQTRPPSAASSRRKKRRDTAVTASTMDFANFSGGSSDTVVLPTPTLGPAPSAPSASPKTNIVRVRSSRQRLSTVVSSSSLNCSPPSAPVLGITVEENNKPIKPLPSPKRASGQPSSGSSTTSYFMKRRDPFKSSDISSLNILQDLVSPKELLGNKFVSSPLTEARIKLPPVDQEEESTLSSDEWVGSGSGASRVWDTGDLVRPSEHSRELLAMPERDPKFRWSVDF